jgi:hypothetical protein
MGRISSVIEGIGFNAHVHLAKLIAYRTSTPTWIDGHFKRTGGALLRVFKA